jgi:hypothetical protein
LLQSSRILYYLEEFKVVKVMENNLTANYMATASQLRSSRKLLIISMHSGLQNYITYVALHAQLPLPFQLPNSRRISLFYAHEALAPSSRVRLIPIRAITRIQKEPQIYGTLSNCQVYTMYGPHNPNATPCPHSPFRCQLRKCTHPTTPLRLKQIRGLLIHMFPNKRSLSKNVRIK